MVATRAANDTLANPAELHLSPEQKHVSEEMLPNETFLHPVDDPEVPQDLTTAKKESEV